MKKYLVAVVILAGWLGTATPVFADLQCFEPPYTTPLSVQNANQCKSLGTEARLFDTSSNTWTNPSTGATVGSPVPQSSAAGPNPQGSGSPSAKQPGANITYTPLEPIPGVNTTSTDLPHFLQSLYGILITLGGIIAVGSLVWAGTVYMTSEISEKKRAARLRIQATFWGLLILISSYLVINTINPQLLEFRFLNSLGSSAAPGTQAPALSNTTVITNADIDDCESAGKHLVAERINNQLTGNWSCQ